MNKHRLLITAAISIVLAGCAVGPDYHKPDAALPGAWVSAQAVAPAAALQEDWWKHFNDPVLNQLIAKAASDNIDLKIAQERIVEARGNRAVSRADLLPTGDVGTTGERQGNRLAFPGGEAFGLKKPFNNFQAGFDASWESTCSAASAGRSSNRPRSWNQRRHRVTMRVSVCWAKWRPPISRHTRLPAATGHHAGHHRLRSGHVAHRQ